MIIDKLNSCGIKAFSKDELEQLCSDVREKILSTVLDKGGHLSSNLGVVELTVALHYVFNFPKDKLIFDVGHQCYTHKILSGRYNKFHTLRNFGGISGFPNIGESEFDTYNSGHASTALAIANGLAMTQTQGEIISLVGDGAATGGLFYEAFQNFVDIKRKQILIINDNEYSISKNQGFTHNLFKDLSVLKPLINNIKLIEIENGNDLSDLIDKLLLAKSYSESVIIRVKTEKGKGHSLAEIDPVSYHSYTANKGVENKSFSVALGNALVNLAEKHKDFYAITAAMTCGTGLDILAEKYPHLVKDVMIAEEYAVTMAAGLALGGIKPFITIYSTFLQRAYDGVIHDICNNNLPAVFCIDRAGIVQNDGETHQGIFDIGYLSVIPNMTILAPKDTTELKKAVEYAYNYNAPIALRYPKTEVLYEYKANNDNLELGKWERVFGDEDAENVIISFGKMLENSVISAEQLNKDNINTQVINARFIKPLDEQMLMLLSDKKITVVEDNLASGGLGQMICAFYASKCHAKLNLIALKSVPKCGDITSLHIEHKLDSQSIAESVKAFVGNEL